MEELDHETIMDMTDYIKVDYLGKLMIRFLNDKLELIETSYGPGTMFMNCHDDSHWLFVTTREGVKGFRVEPYTCGGRKLEDLIPY